MPVPFLPRAAIWLRPPSAQGLAASLLQSSIRKAGGQGPEEGHMQCPSGRASEQSEAEVYFRNSRTYTVLTTPVRRFPSGGQRAA